MALVGDGPGLLGSPLDYFLLVRHSVPPIRPLPYRFTSGTYAPIPLPSSLPSWCSLRSSLVSLCVKDKSQSLTVVPLSSG